MDIAQHLEQLEQSLLTREVRQDAARLTDLLTEDFREFGSSGRAYTRAEIIATLQAEPPAAPSFRLKDFHLTLLAQDVALATYRAEKEDAGHPASSLRSSLWVLRASAWRICFHQGTKVSDA